MHFLWRIHNHVFNNVSFVLQSDSQSFCWCVDHKAGTTITGTSVKGGRPNCDASVRSINLASTSLREWKKCSSEQRDNFKTQLMHYLRHVMLQETEVNRQTRYRLPQSTSVSLGEEQVAKWHFNQLDQNHNGVSFLLTTIDNFWTHFLPPLDLGQYLVQW